MKFPAHDTVARHLARLQLDNDSALYSQHIKGSCNVIADMLSRDFHLSNNQLTIIFIAIFPEQVHSNFKIHQLSKEIISWIYFLRNSLPVWKASRQAPKTSKLGAFFDGNDTAIELESKISSLMTSKKRKRSASFPDFAPALEEIKTAKRGWKNWREAQSLPPSQMYVRPFARTYGSIPL